MWRRGAKRHGQTGQATVEWVGLVLVAALALSALAAGVRGTARGESGLGEAVAERITCAARDLCRSGAAREARPGSARPRARARGAPARSDAADAFRRLRAVEDVAKNAWIACLGYRRWRYDVEHPPTPREALPGQEMPLKDALEIANDCFNPLAFLGG